jgi:hypothetical protein
MVQVSHTFSSAAYINGTNNYAEVPSCKLGNTSPTYLIYVIHSLLNYEFIPPLIFGLPGNIMIIVIASRKHNRHLSASVYMSAMAFVDAVLLLMEAILWPVLYGTHLVKQARDTCIM